MAIYKDSDNLGFISGLKSAGRKIVFTNGVFDIIHRGHIEYLNDAKSLGDVLIVGLNSDESVRRIKGEKRPVVSEYNRAIVLDNLKAVDHVVIFTDDTPEEIIKLIRPDILVKGGDWNEDEIIGADFVRNTGGQVMTIRFRENNSTTSIINRIIELYCPQ